MSSGKPTVAELDERVRRTALDPYEQAAVNLLAHTGWEHSVLSMVFEVDETQVRNYTDDVAAEELADASLYLARRGHL